MPKSKPTATKAQTKTMVSASQASKSKKPAQASVQKSAPKKAASPKPTKSKPVAKAVKSVTNPADEAPASAQPAVAPTQKANGAAPKSRKVGDIPSITHYILGTRDKATKSDEKLSPFLRKQKERLLLLRDAMLDSMNGVAQDNLRSRAEGSEASAFGMHQADAGSDAYDRDFALSLLSQEQDALYEIDEALKRIDQGTYGICEMSGKDINHERLEAIPFTRFTVECQSQLEKQNKAQRVRQSVTSLFGLTEDGENEKDDEEYGNDSKD